MSRLEGRDLEYHIMGKIGIPDPRFLVDHPEAHRLEVAAIEKLPKVIEKLREEGYGIAAPNVALISQAREISKNETREKMFEVLSYVVDAHIKAYSEAQSDGGRSEEEVFGGMSDFLQKKYQDRSAGGEVKLS